MLDLWLKILDIMDRLMNSGQGDNLEEAVPESVKNILLVMADGGFLVPPEPGSPSTELWTETSRRVERFLPGLIAELFPQAKASPPDPRATKRGSVVSSPKSPTSPTVGKGRGSIEEKVGTQAEGGEKEPETKTETKPSDVE